MKRNHELTDVVSIRISAPDRRLLEQVSKEVPAIPKLTLARLAMRIGLELIRREPAVLVRVKR